MVRLCLGPNQYLYGLYLDGLPICRRDDGVANVNHVERHGDDAVGVVTPVFWHAANDQVRVAYGLHLQSTNDAINQSPAFCCVFA